MLEVIHPVQWKTEEAVLTQSLAKLDIQQPAWDEELRVAGAMRRLKKDASVSSMQDATLVFGRDTVRVAMRRMGLHRMPSTMKY